MSRARAQRRHAWLALASWCGLIVLSAWFQPDPPQATWQEASALRQELQRMREENRDLRARLALPEALTADLIGGYRLLAAGLLRVPLLDVPLADAGSGRRSVVIDVGSEQGVLPGCGVVAPGGLVGIVEDVAIRHARVQLLDDPEFRIAFRVDRVPGLGIVGGAHDRPGWLRPILLRDPIRFVAGDLLLTSGDDGRAPGGILIGTVEDPGDVPTQALVRPVVTLHDLREVAVLLPPLLDGERP